MTENLEEKIVKDFPSFFKTYRKSLMEPMCWGFEHNDGWFDLIYDTCKKIDDHIKTLEVDKRPNFYFTQIKEKFGTLRLYSAGGNKEIVNITDEAEKASANICETCGTKIDVNLLSRSGGWLFTSCQACADELVKQRPGLKIEVVYQDAD